MLKTARQQGARVLSLPPRYANASYDILAKGSPVLATIVKDYLARYWPLAEKGMAPAFVGRTESFKTYATAVLARQVAQSALLPVHWVACGVDLMGVSPWQAREAALLGPWVSAPFLILDDVTTLRANTAAVDLLQAIVLSRFDNQLPTCWTANLPADRLEAGLAENLGVSSARRLLECSAGFMGVV